MTVVAFGRYTLVRQIGRGGMAEIWRAKVVGPSGFVKFLALKMILPDISDDQTFVSMFVDEAKLAASLVHPNLIQVFDFGEIDQRLFLAMEYVPGASVDRVLSRLQKEGGSLSSDVAIYIALEACRGLGCAHAKTDANGKLLGIVHRDISPQNLLVSKDGDVKVGDFGIAKAASVVPRTATGHVRGKMAYMSPEQLTNRDIDGRTDLFALGIVLYEMLTTQRLFRGKSSEEVSDRVRRFDPLADLDLETVPASIRDVLVTALQPDPERRYRDAAAFEAALGTRLGLAGIARARAELAATVGRLFKEALAADARDERSPELVDDTMANVFGAEPIVTRSEAPTTSERRPEVPATPTAVGQVETVVTPASREVRQKPRRRIALVAGVGAVGVAVVAIAMLRHGGASDGHARGGMIQLAIGAESERYDLFSIERSRTRFAMQIAIEPLLHGTSDGEIGPWVLDRTKVDGHTIILHVRPDVWFHDHPCLPDGHGHRATGADVAYSLRLALAHDNLALPIRNADEVRKGTAPADALGITSNGDEVTLALTDPAPFYEVQLANVRLVPRELEGCEDVRKMRQPVGTGPFRFATPPHGVRMELLAAPHYWHHGSDGSQLPYVDGISIRPIDDPRDTIAQMGRGEIDLALPESWTGLVDLSGARPQVDSAFRELGIDIAARSSRNRVEAFGVYVGPKEGPLHDVRVRRALARALDRAALVAVSERKMEMANNRFLDIRMLGYAATLEGIPFDPAGAKALLREVGPVPPITLATIHDQVLGALLVKQAAAVGLDVRVETIAPAHASEALDHADALLITDTWGLYDGEAAEIVGEMNRIGNVGGLTTLRLSLSATQDRADRAPIYRRIEEALLSELPMIPIAWGDGNRHPLDMMLVGKHARGFHDPVTGSGSLDELEKTWLAR